MNKTCIQIAREIAVEMNLSTAAVMDMIDSEMEYIGVIMKKGEFESIRLPHFGIFMVKPKRAQVYNERRAKALNKRNKQKWNSSTSTTTELSSSPNL